MYKKNIWFWKIYTCYLLKTSSFLNDSLLVKSALLWVYLVNCIKTCYMEWPSIQCKSNIVNYIFIKVWPLDRFTQKKIKNWVCNILFIFIFILLHEPFIKISSRCRILDHDIKFNIWNLFTQKMLACSQISFIYFKQNCLLKNHFSINMCMFYAHIYTCWANWIHRIC